MNIFEGMKNLWILFGGHQKILVKYQNLFVLKTKIDVTNNGEAKHIPKGDY